MSQYLTRLEFAEIDQDSKASPYIEQVVVVGAEDTDGNPWDGELPWENIVKKDNGYYEPQRGGGGTQTPAPNWRDGDQIAYYPCTWTGGTAIYELIEYRSRWQIYNTTSGKYTTYPDGVWVEHGNDQDTPLWLSNVFDTDPTGALTMTVNEDIRGLTQVRAWKDATSADAIARINPDFSKQTSPGGGMVRPQEYAIVTGVQPDDGNTYQPGTVIKFTTAEFSGGNPDDNVYRYWIRYRESSGAAWLASEGITTYDNTVQEVEFTVPMDRGGYQVQFRCKVNGLENINPPDVTQKFSNSVVQDVPAYTPLYRTSDTTRVSPNLDEAVVGDTITYTAGVFAGGTPDQNIYEYRYGYFTHAGVATPFDASLVGTQTQYTSWQPYDNSGGTFTLPLTDDTISELTNGADWFAGKRVYFQVKVTDPTNGAVLYSGIDTNQSGTTGGNRVQPRPFSAGTPATTFDESNVYEVGETISFTLGQWLGGYPYPDDGQTGNNYNYALQYEEIPGSGTWISYPERIPYTYDEDLTKTIELPPETVNKKARVGIWAFNSDMGMTQKASTKAIPGDTVDYGPLVVTGAPQVLNEDGSVATSVDWNENISHDFPDVSGGPPVEIEDRCLTKAALASTGTRFIVGYRDCVDGEANSVVPSTVIQPEDLLDDDVELRWETRYTDADGNQIVKNAGYVPVTADLGVYQATQNKVNADAVAAEVIVDSTDGIYNVIPATYYGTPLNDTKQIRIVLNMGNGDQNENARFNNWRSDPYTLASDISLSDPRWCYTDTVGSEFSGTMKVLCQTRLKNADGDWVVSGSTNMYVRPASTMGTVSIANDSGTDPASTSAGGNVTFTAACDGDVDMPYYVWSVRDSDQQYVESTEVIYDGDELAKRAHKFKVTLKADVPLGTSIITQLNAYSAFCTDTTQQTLTETITVLS